MRSFASKKRKRLFGPLLLTMLVIMGVWGGGFLIFLQLVPQNTEDQTTQTDAIVVLTGGTQRLNTGLTLLAEHKAKKLLISGVYHGVELKEILALSKEAPDELECCIDIGHDADNTRGNAQETKNWIDKTGFKSIRLVTANYHMPRSLLEFSFEMPYIDIVAHPVFPRHVKVDQWWRWPGTAYLLISEYNKYLLVWMRQEVSRQFDVSL